MSAFQSLFCFVAFHAFGAQIDEHHVAVCAACDDVQATFHQLISQGLGVFNDLFLVGFEFRAQGFAECDCFARDDVHQRSTLNAREDRRVEFLSQSFVVGQDHTATWAAQCFVRGCCCDMCVWEWGRVDACGNQTCKVGHVDHEIRTNAVSNFAHTGKIDDTWDGRTTCDDQFRLMFRCQLLDLIVI